MRTRERIVLAAVDDASRVGLEGLTVGSLARRLGMSKAGLIGPFGSRERLQAAVLEQAGAVFRATVIEPLEGLPPGVRRLERLIDGWVDYLGDCPFPGGCFVTAASFELDGRPGALRERLREIVTGCHRTVAGEVAAAQGELPGRIVLRRWSPLCWSGFPWWPTRRFSCWGILGLRGGRGTPCGTLLGWASESVVSALYASAHCLQEDLCHDAQED